MQRQIMWLGGKIHDALVEFAEENNEEPFSLDLCGACAIGSYLLVKEARRRFGIRLNFKATNGHAWVEHRGLIYDITASQFDYPYRIRVRHRRHVEPKEMGSRHYLDQYQERGREAIESVNYDWPFCQRPKFYDLKWVNQHKAKILCLNDMAISPL